MPWLDKCVPSHLNKFISRARMLQWRITQQPKLNTRFLTRKLTRLRTLSIALPSVALCQYLLCKISDHIILTSGSNVRRRSKPHSISVNNCQLFVKPIIVHATSMNLYRHETLMYVPPIGRVVFLFGDIKAKKNILKNLEYFVRNETRQYKNRFYILNVECKL